MKKSIILITIISAFTACNQKEVSKDHGHDHSHPHDSATSTLTKEDISKAVAKGKKKVAQDVPRDSIFSFDEYHYNFGTIKEGEVVKHTFTFTNTSEQTVKIVNATASCGCTVPTYEKGRLLTPGSKGKIDVEFNSAGKQGKMVKSIRIYTDATPKVMRLQLTGMVEVDEKL